MAVRNALILAAGDGRRLQPGLRKLPKPLLSVGGMPLLRRVILSVQQAGIRSCVIVVGGQGRVVQNYFAQHPVARASLQWVKNRDHKKDNGVSALKARRKLREPFLLLMADHIFESRTARALLRQKLLDDDVILAVDRKLDRVHDLEDATKVRVEGERITDIGKSVTNYNALDTGMFLCRPALFDALQASLKNGNCSLSDGMRFLAQRSRMRAFDIRDALWHDVDTPQAVVYAESLLREHGEDRLRLGSARTTPPAARCLRTLR